jgi:lipid II:glycine glycyltransferase (peptidoglycan interpeptide bridge formation enzyme)
VSVEALDLPERQRVEGDGEWTRILESLPAPHLLQSAAWGEFKSHYGWTPERWVWKSSGGTPLAAAQVLRRWGPGSRRWTSVLYCPRGPAMDWTDRRLAEAVLRDLARWAAESPTTMIKIEPDAVASPEAEDVLRRGGWLRSSHPVQFNSTMLLDLRQSDDEMLAGMKAKTRYNIRLAQKRGVIVRPGTAADIDRLYALYAETSVRDGFVIRPRDYYGRAWTGFIAAGLAQPFLAEVDGEAVAGLIAFRFGRRAWYLYGMSGSAHREAMPNHALQWAAIRWARDAGCEAYDFWGAPEAADPEDPLWGLYRFKEGFGARHVRLIGSWDHPARPWLFWIYSIALPRVLSWTRRRQAERTRQMVDPSA